MKIDAIVKKQTRLQGLGAGAVMRVKTTKFNTHDRYVMCVRNGSEWLLVDLELGTVWETIEGEEVVDLSKWIQRFNSKEGNYISVCEQAEMKVLAYE